MWPRVTRRRGRPGKGKDSDYRRDDGTGGVAALMIEMLLGPLVFIGYVVVVGIALVLALVVFSAGDDGERRARRRRSSPAHFDDARRPAGKRTISRSRSWWRQWR
ncbi:MAG: hypothetical protein ACR2K0_05385 [Acidimicrobiales bacterium]